MYCGWQQEQLLGQTQNKMELESLQNVRIPSINKKHAYF